MGTILQFRKWIQNTKLFNYEESYYYYNRGIRANDQRYQGDRVKTYAY